MPFYTVQHAVPLTVSQQDELAEALTTLHSTRFTTPRLFVNVGFTDVSKATTYVAGRRKVSNTIQGFVRAGATRTQQDWDDHSRDIAAAWDRIIGKGLPQIRPADAELDYSIRGVFIIGGLIAGYEAGFTLPSAGNDVTWLKENLAGFQKVADEGDEDFQELIRDVKARGLVNDGGNAK
jgi:phenylpyruvate tautomerase PptA (4-oxalocrotonate tautomerase family)